MSLYDVLGVDRGVSPEDLKRAFRKKAKESHEDKGGSNEEMVRVNEAWMVLRDAKRRDKYDRTGETENDSFEMRFRGYVQSVFMQLVDVNDVDYSDLVGEFRGLNDMAIEDGKGKLKEAKKRKVRLEKVAERLSEGVVRQVVESNCEGIRNEMGMIEEHLEFLRECGECLKSVHYKFDESPPVKSFRSSKGFVDWNNVGGPF